MKTILFTRPVVRILVVTGFVLGLGAIVWLNSGLPSPRERDRVVAPQQGFSIIKPPGWDSRVLYGSPTDWHEATIEITPVKSVGLMTRFCAAKFREPPDVQKLRETFRPFRFQNRDALIFASWVKREYLFRLIFQRDGGWYEISLRPPSELDVLNSDWWKYIETFRIVENPATKAQ
jgi:hypothetical protein